LQAKKRLHNELEDYRTRRAADLEDKESSMEQTRKKYQAELQTLTGELEIERENLVQSRAENRRLRDEVEDLRAKWDDEVLNSSTWAKEKSRLEVQFQDLQQSHDEAVAAHNEVQGRVVSLLAQVRSLRANVDEVVADRDLLQKEKRSLEQRLAEASQRLEDLANGESPAMRNAAGMDRELLELKGSLARQEDLASAAMEKMRRAEALASETQRDIAAERESNVSLHKEKAQLVKLVKDLQLRLVDLETKSYSSTSHDIRFLHTRVQEVFYPPPFSLTRILTPHCSLKTNSKNTNASNPNQNAQSATSTEQCATCKRKSTAETKSTPSSRTRSQKAKKSWSACLRRSRSCRPPIVSTSWWRAALNARFARNARSVLDSNGSWRAGRDGLGWAAVCGIISRVRWWL
jgi:regulator of replication initiation timing